MSKTSQLNLRVSEEQRAAYERAAALEGTTVSALVTGAADNRAQAVLDAHASITVPSDVFDRLLAQLDAPPRPLAHAVLEVLAARRFENR